MSTSLKKYDKYKSRKYFFYYFIYALGLWILYFLYIDLPVSNWVLVVKAILYAMITSGILFFIIGYVIKNYKIKKGRKYSRKSLPTEKDAL